jgi:hypothetical protein
MKFLALLSCFDFLPAEARLSRCFYMKWSYITGAMDPSDHLPTGTIKTSIG